MEIGRAGRSFWDTILRESVADCYADLGFRTASTNPCGEIPLCPYDSCRLLAINLYSYVVNPFKEDAYFDFDLFSKHAKLAQRIMDDIIDLEAEKIDKILEKIDNDPESEEIKIRSVVYGKKFAKRPYKDVEPAWVLLPKAICLRHLVCVTVRKRLPIFPRKCIKFWL